MISGHITKAVQSVFKKSGIDVKVTSTSFRKAGVTAVHFGKPALSGKVLPINRKDKGISGNVERTRTVNEI